MNSSDKNPIKVTSIEDEINHLNGQYFSFLFRIHLRREFEKCETAAKKILDTVDDLTEIEKRYIFLFTESRKHTFASYDQAELDSMNELKNFFIENNFYEGAYICTFFIASHHTFRGEYDRATDYLKEALEYNQFIDEKYYSNTYSRIGYNYESAAENNIATEYIADYGRLAVEKAGDDGVLLSYALRCLFLELCAEKKWEEAYEVTHRLKQVVEQENFLAFEQYLSEQFYLCYYYTGEFEKAEKCALDMITADIKNGEKENITWSYIYLCDAYLSTQKYDLALENAEFAVKHALDCNIFNFILEAYKRLINAKLLNIGRTDIIENMESMNMAFEHILQQKYESAFDKKTSDLQFEIVERERQYERNSNKLKSDFLANMSHEIRTPMNAVIGMIEFILQDEISENVRANALIIKRTASILLTIINDILDFSKIEAGKMEIVEENYQLASVINDIVNMTSIRIGENPVKFNVNVDNNLPSQLLGDEVRIKQIFINLVTNAVKFTKEGSIELNISGKYNFDKTENVLEISVKDTGVGIKEEDIEKIFSSFSQVDTKRNRTEDGTGLGLAISKRLCEMMGGKLWVESEYGKGSKFSFVIVQKVSDNTPIGDFRKKKLETKSFTWTFTAPKAKVLVVDDNDINLLVAKGMLESFAITTDTSQNAEDAIELIKTKEYDLVFMDHMMPEKDGMEATEEIRGNEDEYLKGLPIIALTANAINGAREMYMGNGFTDFLAKPIEVKDLSNILHTYLPKELIEELER